MPQVPYSPVPSASPENIPSPLMRIQGITPEAFGVNVGRAIEHLGSTEQQVGGELFQRALAMQDLRNETEATEANAQHDLGARKLQTDYTQKMGLDAVNGLEDHQKAQDDLRKSIREGLSNDRARKNYDRISLYTMNRELGIAASHAAQQNKTAAHGASVAEEEMHKDSVLAHPDDADNYNHAQQGIRDAVLRRSALEGWGDIQTKQALAKAQSGLTTALIEGKLRHDPYSAKDIFDANRQYMDAKDIQHIEPKIQNQNRIVGSRNISDAVNSGWAPYMKPGEIAKTKDVQEPLNRIMQQAQRDNPNVRFTIISGQRTVEQQMRLFQEGKTTTIHGSNHLAGRAIDIQPLEGTTYEQAEASIKAASAKLGIPIGDEHDRIRSWDPGHYSLPKEYDVGSAPKHVDEPLTSRLDRGVRYAESQNTDDPLFPDVVKDRIGTDWIKTDRIRRQTDADNTNMVLEGILNRGDGRPAANMDDLLADSARRAAYDALPPDKQRQIPGKILGYNKSLEQQTDQAYKTQLTGMLKDSPEEAIKVDPMDPSLPLSQRDRQWFINQQKIAKRNSLEKDPQISRALRILDPMINDPNLHLDKKNNPEEYHEFVGVLAQVLEDQAKEGKKPSFEEIQKTGKQLLYGIATKKWFGLFDATKPLYNIGNTLSPKERDDIRQEMMKDAPGSEVTDLMIDIEAARQAWQQLYGKKK